MELKSKKLTKTTLDKIKGQLKAKFAIPSRHFSDNESFVAMGISSMQMHNFIDHVQEHFAVSIDMHRVNYFDIDSPLKLANLVDKLVI